MAGRQTVRQKMLGMALRVQIDAAHVVAQFVQNDGQQIDLAQPVGI